MIINFKLKNDKTEIKLINSNKVFYPTETTRYLLNSTIKKINKNKKLEILDLGCGNGVIGIFLLKKFKKIKRMTFSDISVNATKLTKKNLKLNKINPKKYQIIKSNQFQNLTNKKFDIIINDVSGISSKIAKMTNWFKNVPCNSGIDGTKLTVPILTNSVGHLNNNGFTGEKSEKSFEMIGAMDGVGYENEEFSIEIYQFEDPKDISKELSHRNGQFGMLIHRPKVDDYKIKKMIDVFNSFE